MSEAIDDDPVVQAAIRLLPVPAHGDDFWAELGRRLDEADGPRAPHQAASVFVLPVLDDAPVPAADPTPVPGPRPHAAPEPTLAVIPVAMRRRSNLLLAAVAVAALLVVGVAGSALVSDDSDSGGTQLAGGDPVATTAPVDSATAPAGVPEALSKQEVSASTAAATTFAADHAEAGTTGDWDQVLVTPVPSGKGETLAVVTLVGAAGTETYAVRLTSDGAEVVPEDSAGAIEMVAPEPVADDGTEATVSGSDDLVVVLPTGASAPVLRLDDGTPVICGEAEGTHLAPMDGMDRQRCAWTLTTLAPGAHTLTVAFTDDDGSSISADSVTFQAA